ncbi:glutathione S-transferase [Microdochium trichocladiopsis]|uniref:Glutathione S-transferase n=1 Tax=Microdochium trichocladiopsis TaxID=1682393 RepID=A0A9P8XPM8_9PEZI|nr:glutathione S-transferase [Microdochium trichocladiopsis]KAH7009364.1 glutathione S-transferase [Microdochium trichocladiopsis]
MTQREFQAFDNSNSNPRRSLTSNNSPPPSKPSTNIQIAATMSPSTQRADLKPLTLHAHSGGPNPFKIASALEFLSLPYTVKVWDFNDDPTTGLKGTTFLTTISENGRVPALEDPNVTVDGGKPVISWESGACMNYLRRVYDADGKVLGPRNAKGETGSGKVSEQDRVDFEKWEYLLLTTVGPMMGQTNWFRHYNPTPNEDALNRYVGQVNHYFGLIEKQLAKTDGASILPGGVTAVDLHYEGWIHQTAYAGIDMQPYPLLAKWAKMMIELEPVKAAYAKIKAAAK